MSKIAFAITKKLDYFTVAAEYEFDGGVLVIQGESGAGKTTLLNCIAGLSAPDEGVIRVGERTLFRRESGGGGRGKPRILADMPARKRRIGYLFQNYALFPNMTVGQNVLYGIKNKAEYKAPAKRAEMVGYADYIMETFGIAHLRGKRPDAVSGGEKQRVALARAIVTKPDLLLLDEPFSALDEATRNAVYEEFMIFKKNFRIPAILITHNTAESEMFGDHRLQMKQGRVEA